MSLEQRAEHVLTALRSRASEKTLADMAPRYGIVAEKAFGTPVGEIKLIAKEIGRDRALAAALWETGWYEARMLCAFIDDPAQVTPGQMDRWRADFDNWAVTDHLCFHLFDKTPHAFAKVHVWATLNDEFGRRAAFALLASLALHDKKAPDVPFLDALPLIEAHAADGRNFVKKAISWALRGIGHRKSPALKAAALETAQRLAASSDPSTRWVGKDALKAFTKAGRE